MSHTDAGPEKLRVGVLGAAGYVGGELLRLLAGHPQVGELHAYSSSHADQRWSSAHPHLLHTSDGTFEAPDPQQAANQVDVLFLALAHGRAQKIVPQLIDSDVLLVDLSADYRVSDPTLYARFYGEHDDHEQTARFTYALADTHGALLRKSARLAIPGCFATAALLATYPFAKLGSLENAPAFFAITGSSGSGATAKRTTHHPVRANNVFAYGLDGHRHQAEIADQLARWVGSKALGMPTLVTHSGPFVRGIYLTWIVRPSQPVTDPLGMLRAAYEGRPFVRVVSSPPELSEVVGTNFAHLHAAARDGGREVVVSVAIDNLVKGAAGQAIQSMNLALDFDETAGLSFPGLYTC